MKLNRFMAVIILICTIFCLPRMASAQSGNGTVLVLNATGTVTPAMEQYILRGLKAARDRDVNLVIIQLDTPGGRIDTMNKIVEAIRASTIPVVVYVAPRGAMAGSAGSIITLAGHAAAMAPETIIGAASPVDSNGEDIGETMKAKTTQALTATIRTLASHRPPEAIKLAEEMVITAKAVSADEALKVGLVDIIADDTDSLLRQLNGMQVYVNDKPVTLMTEGLVQEPFDATFVENLLAILINANIVFLLLVVGVQAILIELSSPGGWVSGFIGVVCLALAIYGLGVLPVNWFGILFIAIAFGLFFVEIQAPTHGAATVAGAVCLAAGGLVLFNTNATPIAFRVSVPLVVGTAAGLAVIFSVIVGYALKSQKVPVQMGMHTMIGKETVLRETLETTGEIFINGEAWTAENETGQNIPAGVKVKVVRLEGLRVIVQPVESDPTQTGAARN